MTIRSFALEISPFYELMLFCIQLILCLGSKPRRYGVPALVLLGTIYVVLPWRIEQLHRMNIFLIGNISIGHSVMSFISMIIFFSCFHISWQRAILQGTITNILQFLWFIITIQFYILIPQVRSFWLLYAIALQMIVFAFVAFFFRKAISWEQADRMDKGRLIAIFLSVTIILMLLYAEFNEKLKNMEGGLIYLFWGVLLYVLLYSVLSADKLQQEKELMEKLL